MGRRKGRGAEADDGLDEVIARCDLGVSGKVVELSRTPIASLWAGYGTLERLTVRTDAGGEETFVLKNILCPPGATGVDVKRKRASYRNEKHFYAKIAPPLLASTSLRVPQPVSLFEHGDRMVLILRDISPDFPVHGHDLSDVQVRSALEWLAGFHAAFWEQPEKHAGMAGCGSYWHLDSRPQEFAHLTGARWERLRNAAPAIDARLKGQVASGGGTVRSKRHLTLIHGDFKPANIQFARREPRCVVYDFQYCGRGYGVRDLCYLLFPALPWLSEGRALAEHYHRALMHQLPDEQRDYTVDAMLSLCRLAVLDFYRFLIGWQYAGRSVPRGIEQTIDGLLANLDGGRTLSPEEYAEAVAERYPLPGS